MYCTTTSDGLTESSSDAGTVVAAAAGIVAGAVWAGANAAAASHVASRAPFANSAEMEAAASAGAA